MEKKLATGIFSRIKSKQAKAALTEFPFQVSFEEDQFIKWITEQIQIQNGRCHYCETSQDDINRLIKAEILTSKRFKTRGKNLELERLDSKGNSYSPENCVLVCYFCNNDKSDVVSSNDYIQFFAESKELFMQHLLNKLKLK